MREKAGREWEEEESGEQESVEGEDGMEERSSGDFAHANLAGSKTESNGAGLDLHTG